MVCTIGYQLRPIEELLRLLGDAEVDVVIDVRETPWSYVPAYREATLRGELASRGIRYIHAPFAGNPKRFRKEAASYREALDRYRAYLEENPSILAQFGGLLDRMLEQKLRCCLLCYERHPEDCHRQILLEALGASGSVEHLAPDGAPRFN